LLSDVDTARLLEALCVKLGFCLPPEERRRLQNEPPGDVKEFTDAVFAAEGLNPDLADRHLYRQVRTMVQEAFAGGWTP
jgi:hypothetical protein